MFVETCESLAAAALGADETTFAQLVPAAQRRAAGLSGSELTEGTRVMTRGIAEAGPRSAGWLAVLAGAFVEAGAHPKVAGAVVVDRLMEVLESAVRFAEAWEHAVDVPPPAPQSAEPPPREAWAAVRPVLGGDAERAMESWWALPQFAMAACTMLASLDVRVLMPDRAARAGAVARAARHCEQLEYVRDLMRVLDGERLLVLDRVGGRGWTVVISGIVDNFQLHTLLADALIGPGRLPGEAPDPRWVAAALDQDVPPGTPPVSGTWNLVDAHGDWIWNEGTPADIPAIGAFRIVVLDPPAYQRTWSPGRRFSMMRASLSVQAGHEAADLHEWWRHVRPAREPARG